MKRTVLEVHLNDVDTALQVFDYLDKMGYTWVSGESPKQCMYYTVFRWDCTENAYVLLDNVAVYMCIDSKIITWCRYGYNSNRDLTIFLEGYEFLYSLTKNVIILNRGDV